MFRYLMSIKQLLNIVYDAYKYKSKPTESRGKRESES